MRQAIAKALVAYYAKYIDAYSAMELKKKLVAYDRTLLIADPRRMEPKKFGGAGARARRQKRYVLHAVIRVCHLRYISGKLPLSCWVFGGVSHSHHVLGCHIMVVCTLKIIMTIPNHYASFR